MKKYMKYIILVVCIIIIGVICGVFFGNKNSTEIVNAEEENIIDNSVVEENTTIENTSVEDNMLEEQNVISNKLAENKVIDETTSKKENVYEQDNDVGSTDKKQEAINLVKEKWGQDDTVTFRCDSVTSKGEYVIAVVSKNGSGVKNYFKVNLEKKEVQIHY